MPARLSTAEFEALEASRAEPARLEFVDGVVAVKPLRDGDHGEIAIWLLRCCLAQRPEPRLYPEQGLITEAYGQGRSRPDGALAPKGCFKGRGEWSQADGVLMVVEVTSSQPENGRDAKPVGYAFAGIPVYLLIDRRRGELVVHSNPSGGRYGDTPHPGVGGAAAAA
jgi:Uma2 family endonuclease